MTANPMLLRLLDRFILEKIYWAMQVLNVSRNTFELTEADIRFINSHEQTLFALYRTSLSEDIGDEDE